MSAPERRTPTLEEYLEQGEIAGALLLKGGWSNKEVEIIRAAWEEGFKAGYAAHARADSRAHVEHEGAQP